MTAPACLPELPREVSVPSLVMCAALMFSVTDGTLTSILQRLPGIGVWGVDLHGTVQFASEQARQMHAWHAVPPVGRTLLELDGRDAGSEWLSVIDKVTTSGRPAGLRRMLAGRDSETTFWPLDRAEYLLAVTRQAFPLPGAGDWPILESQHVDLGPLDVLSNRELEVLSLLGRGAPIKAIATQLKVSRRTVERHRTAVARKLGVHALTDLAQLVWTSGLTLERVPLRRIRRHFSA